MVSWLIVRLAWLRVERESAYKPKGDLQYIQTSYNTIFHEIYGVLRTSVDTNIPVSLYSLAQLSDISQFRCANVQVHCNYCYGKPKGCLIPYQQNIKAEFASHARISGDFACNERSECQTSTFPRLRDGVQNPACQPLGLGQEPRGDQQFRYGDYSISSHRIEEAIEERTGPVGSAVFSSGHEYGRNSTKYGVVVMMQFAGTRCTIRTTAMLIGVGG